MRVTLSDDLPGCYWLSAKCWVSELFDDVGGRWFRSVIARCGWVDGVGDLKGFGRLTDKFRNSPVLCLTCEFCFSFD